MAERLKVLVVEDEPIVRFDIVEHLSGAGFDVIEATESSEAFDLLEAETNIDILLTDIDMPGAIDGLMLAKFAAERWPHVRVVVVSGKRRTEITDLPDGARFFSKPYDLTAIASELKAWNS